MMANSLLSLVYTQADKVVVSKLLPVAEFGFYSFASSTVGRAAFVAAAIGQAAFPSFANLSAAGEHGPLMRQFRKLQELVSFVTAPMFAAICFAATPVYSYLFNPAVASRLLVPTILLAVGFYMNSGLNPPFMLSFAVGKPQIIVRANVVALFVVLPVTVLLIATKGLTGAAASWVFYNLFAYAYIVPKICRDALQITAWSWYRRVLVSGGLALVAYALSWYLIARPASFSLAALTVAYVAASLVFAAVAYFLIDSDLRDTLVRVVRSLAPRRAAPDDPMMRAPASTAASRPLTETLIVGSTGVVLCLALSGRA
jgi:O-antigen/teichoic acid export membrane protein